jgi:hypothetical protein
MGFLKKVFSCFSSDEEEKGDSQKKYVPVSGKTTIVENNVDSEVEKTMHIDFTPPKQQYIVKIDGEYSVYESKADMPEEMRQEIEEVENAEGVASSYTVIVQGERKTYSSLDEVPEEVRQAIDKN